MTEQPKFTSRRELRDAERAGLVESETLGFDGTPRVSEVSVPVESTGQPLTRRQLRELEKTGGVLAIHTSQIQLPELPQAAEDVMPVSDVPLDTVSQPYVAPDVVGAEREEPLTVASPIIELAEATAPAEHVPVIEAPVAKQPVVEAPDVIHTPQASPELAAKALAAAAEFEAILQGAVQSPTKIVKRTRRNLIITVAVLLIVVGGLAIAASALHILK